MMDIGEFFASYWWVFVMALPLFIFYLRNKSGKTIGDFNKYEMEMIVEFGFYILLIYLIQNYIFPSHWFFIITMPIVIILISLLIYYIKKGDVTYILESTIEGQEFYNPHDGTRIVADNTSQRLLIMNQEVYEDKMHIGDLHYQLWQGTNRIKFTDKYDDRTGIFYHPRMSEFHNFTFYQLKSMWRMMAQQWPELLDRLSTFTLLQDVYISDRASHIIKNTEYHLEAIGRQYKHIPFPQPKTLEDIAKIVALEKKQSLAHFEQPAPEKPKEDNEVKNE